MKLRILANLFLAGIFIQASAEDDAQHWMLSAGTNEASTELSIGEIKSLRSITFNQGSDNSDESFMQVNFRSGLQQNYPLSLLNSLYFSLQSTGVEEISIPSPIFIKGNQLFANDIPSGTIVQIYSIDGRLCQQLAITSSSTPFKPIAPGIYIIKVQDKTIKTIIR